MVAENENGGGSSKVLWLIVLVLGAAAFGYTLGAGSGQERASRRVEDQLDVMMQHLSSADRPAGDGGAVEDPAVVPPDTGAGDGANVTGLRSTALIDS
jgi:hypothetical protein